MPAVKRRYQGLHAFRYRDNPLELKFALEWQKQHDPQHGHRVAGTLPALLGDGITSVEPTTQDYLVAATVIQWLGSPVGEAFLREVGFVRKGSK